MELTGIHHVAGVTSDVESNRAFYEGILDLELCRNDATASGDHGQLSYRERESGNDPFLHFIVDPKINDHKEVGSITRVCFELATSYKYEDSFDYWGDRLDANGVKFDADSNQPMFWFADPDGLPLQIVISWGEDDPEGPLEYQEHEHVPAKYRLTRVAAVVVESADVGASAHFMTDSLACKLHDQRDSWTKSIFNRCGNASLLWTTATRSPGGGLIDHVALGARPGELEGWARRLRASGVVVGPVARDEGLGIESFSIEEPGGAPFEVATTLGE